MKNERFKLAFRWTAAIAVAFSVAALPLLGWRNNELNIRVRFGLARQPDPGGWIFGIDRKFLDVPPDGDLAVRFLNFPDDDAGAGLMAGETIGRGSYAVMPRRLWFADEGAAMNNASYVLRTHFNPSIEWLHAHDVHYLFTYANVNGKLEISVDRVPGTATGLSSAPPVEGSFAAIWISVYVLVILLIGFAITSALLAGWDRRSMAEIIGLILTIGAGGTGTLLMYASLVGLRPGHAIFILLGLAAVISLVVMARSGKLAIPRVPRLPLERNFMTFSMVLPCLILMAGLIASLVLAVGLPVTDWDAFAMWGIKAKVLRSAALSPRPAYFSNVSLGFTHLDYPLLVPMLLAGAYGAMNQFNEQFARVVFPILFAGQAMLIYSGARLWLSRLPALLVATLLICPPIVLKYSSFGNGDMTLVAFWLGSVLYLLRWQMRGQRADLLICAVMGVFAANTKNEGLPLAISIALVFLLLFIAQRKSRSLSWTDAGWFTGILATGIGIWLIWRSGLPHIDENYLGRLTWSNFAPNLGRLGAVAAAAARSMLSIDWWGGLWLVALLLAILGYRALAAAEVRLLWLLLLLQLAIYSLAYIIAPWDLQMLLHDSIERLLLQVAPLAVLLGAAHWGALNGTAAPSNESSRV